VGEEIGVGGFSVVKEATSRVDGEKFAVKIIEKNAIKDELKLVKREVDVMKKTKHPNILQLHEIFEDDEYVYIVMELIDGSELFDRIVEKGFYSERDAVNIVRQIVEAVAYLHDINIVHRDLKPENLLCSGSGENEIVKIADFGLSKFHSGTDKLMTSCGTPGYVAPEVLLSEVYDNSVDMWGIGVITYILLAGYPPFYDENNRDDDTALFEKVIHVEYDFDDECWDEISELARDFIKSLLIKDPSDRLSAKQALKHEWFSSEPPQVDFSKRITRRMSSYNLKRREKIMKIREE
jgi:calcium/calmodulin-dependent protein kinase I